MFIANNEITITWLLEPTATPLLATDFDIKFVTAGLDVTYADAAIINYTAPAVGFAGNLQYVFTPTIPGHLEVYLTTGSGATYTILDKKDFWVFCGAPSTQPVIEVIGPSPVIPVCPTPQFGPTIQGSFGPHLGIGALATDGTKIMIAGHQNPEGLGFWITDMQFPNVVFTPFEPDTGLNSWTGLGYGNGVWFISALFGRTWWSNNDGVSWTESIFPVGTGARVSPAGNFYSKNKGIHYNLFGDAHYSIDDCVNFKAQDDVPSGGQDLVPFSNIYSYSENPFGDTNLIFGGAQERMHHTTTLDKVSNDWSTQIVDFSPSIYNIQHAVGLHNGVLRFAGINSPFHQLRSIDGFTWADEAIAGDLAGVTTNGLSFIRYLPLFDEFWANTQTGPDKWYKSTDGITYNEDVNHPFLGTIHRTDSWDPNTILDLPGDGIAVIGVGVNVGGLAFYISHHTREAL